MADLVVLTEEKVRGLVGLGDAEMAAIEAVYPLISDGRAVMPPIMRLDVEDHNGEVDVKSAYLPGYDGIAIKVSAGFFDNPAKGLPSLGGFMMVLDAETGIPSAALFDNGYLTDLRTALAGAVVAGHLARPGPLDVAVLGAGAQAGLQVRALQLVREVRSVKVWARRRAQADRLAAEVGGEAVGTIADALDSADLVVTATPATDGLVQPSHLHPGMHITAVGSDAEHKRELGPGVLEAADVTVVDSIAQSIRLGEARAAIAEGFEAAALIELGDVISGAREGRTSDDQVTLADLTGTGAQDTAIAALVVAKAREQGVGDVIAT